MKKLLLLIFLCGLFPFVPAAHAGTYFIVQCNYSHTNNDDPLKGLHGSSHTHDYFGSTTTNYFSTYQSMTNSSTTCGTPNDTAGYWAPEPILNGAGHHAMYVRVYYGCGTNCGKVFVTPSNTKFLSTSEKFDCGQSTPVVPYPYDCAPFLATHHDSSNDGVVALAYFSQSATGALVSVRAHLGTAWDSCLPKYPQANPPASTCLKFGGNGMVMEWADYHSDFWNTWNQTALKTEVTNCLIKQPNSCKAFDGTH